MKPRFKYANQIHNKFPHLSVEDLNQLSDFVESKVLANLEIASMEPGKLYMVGVDTGMMPKSKAELHMKQALNTMIDAFKDNGMTPPAIMVVSESPHMSSPTVFELVEGKTYIINIDTGMMPYHKANDYLNGLREIYNATIESRCKLYFMMKNKLIYSFNELEDHICMNYLK